MSRLIEETHFFLDERDRRVLARWIRGTRRPLEIDEERWRKFTECEANSISIDRELLVIVNMVGYGLLTHLRT